MSASVPVPRSLTGFKPVTCGFGGPRGTRTHNLRIKSPPRPASDRLRQSLGVLGHAQNRRLGPKTKASNCTTIAPLGALLC